LRLSVRLLIRAKDKGFQLLSLLKMPYLLLLLFLSSHPSRVITIYLCDVIKFELYYGAYKGSKKDRNLSSLKIFFNEFVSLPFNGEAADICGRIRAELNKKGTPIGVYDIQIASITIANNLVLVTHNIREF
jgi:predicted nucleic acid-binding protein